MVNRLARRSIGAVVLSFLAACGPLQAAEPGAALDSGARQQYLAELKKLYLTDSERQALLRHCNALLDSYALRAGYQVGQAQRRDLLYRLSVGKPGELLVREELSEPGSINRAVRQQPVELFGVDPFVSYECPAGGIRCVLYSPVDREPMLTIVRDLKGAEELAKALSFLIRNLQQG